MNTYLFSGSALLALTVACNAQAQELRRRVESGPDGIVTLSYPARPDACGYGLSVLRIGSASGGWVYSNIDGADGNRCEAGPAIAVINRAGGAVFSIRVGIGPVPAQIRGTDLGTVTAAQAAEYFLDLAERSDGRLGRDALLAGVLSDNRDNSAGLLRIARAATLSRGLRESALSWLGRDLALGGAGADRAVVSALVALARNENDAASVRTRAVTALGRAEGAATTELTALARDESRDVARAALSALSRSPDPKARETLRQAARDRSLPEAVRIEAIRGLGGRDGTPAELAFVRGLWTEESMGTDTRQRILQLVG
ncbi:MAG: HEAT repeat domain-containing protein, partial [Gemmatimonadales bacterium]